MDSDDPKFRAGYAKAKTEHIKWVNEAYRSGYGQAKADMLDLIAEAMSSCNDALRSDFPADASPESLRELRLRQQELARIRALLKGAMKPGF